MSGWTITKDLLEEDDPSIGTSVGTVGPRDATLTHQEIKKHPERQKFRLLDDDNNVYYVGYMVAGSDWSGCEPLDHFGRAWAGCTRIDVWKKGKGGGWKTL